ncbi:hypothetical protein [Halalkalibacter okhensis]|uniref:Uncharacterized protein n=1 Tax=Halalkalibacter okhensis TaxID=333138 RepID=A0A0B0IDP3_9BACI|nr:hypothetical protein [Halalkalibacter okhensis]KHF40718.1 hypothetical protein LQ50_07980 [Halalkalibacter okhensis]
MNKFLIVTLFQDRIKAIRKDSVESFEEDVIQIDGEELECVKVKYSSEGEVRWMKVEESIFDLLEQFDEGN